MARVGSQRHRGGGGIDAQNLFHKFYFTPLHVSNTRVHHQEVKIALRNLWYHHTYRWPSGAQLERVLHQVG